MLESVFFFFTETVENGVENKPLHYTISVMLKFGELKRPFPVLILLINWVFCHHEIFKPDIVVQLVNLFFFFFYNKMILVISMVIASHRLDADTLGLLVKYAIEGQGREFFND